MDASPVLAVGWCVLRVGVHKTEREQYQRMAHARMAELEAEAAAQHKDVLQQLYAVREEATREATRRKEAEAAYHVMRDGWNDAIGQLQSRAAASEAKAISFQQQVQCSSLFSPLTPASPVSWVRRRGVVARGVRRRVVTVWKSTWEDSRHRNTTSPCRYYWASLDVCIGSIARTWASQSGVCGTVGVCCHGAVCVCVCVCVL